jgi:hypothetical protein
MHWNLIAGKEENKLAPSVNQYAFDLARNIKAPAVTAEA